MSLYSVSYNYNVRLSANLVKFRDPKVKEQISSTEIYNEFMMSSCHVNHVQALAWQGFCPEPDQTEFWLDFYLA